MVMRSLGDGTTTLGIDAEQTEELSSTVIAAPAVSSPESSDRPRRRVFTAKDKLRFLDALGCVAGVLGGRCSILHREGVYSSGVCGWRWRRAAALSPAARGPKPIELNLLAVENAQLTLENKRLKQRLERAEAVLLNLPAPNDKKS